MTINITIQDEAQDSFEFCAQKLLTKCILKSAKLQDFLPNQQAQTIHKLAGHCKRHNNNAL